ncbi:RNA-directed DNA methylation 4 isoform X2 [Phoenix dactylifera]|uniref:RNA-directed DNA methylation 4 isoform X2 n=1 Tax=Phoenix dactylifera TaxID=42345 RepID=A0A8B7CIJ4_PHODC|nr:RNA-directed DNA methylation 4 isoform X2 [Phoenix dactylifera]
MAEPGETSASSPPPSNLTKAKPVVVRVKRKPSQARLDAFWLEINERPLKRALVDLGSLSISDSSTGKVHEESRTKKLLVQHVETMRHSEAIKDVLHSFLQPGSSGSKEFKRKIEERRSAHKQDKKQDQLRSAAIQKHEDLARNARFEQIWKSRRGRTDPDEDSLRELCHLYDVVQVDVEDMTSRKVQKPEVSELEDNAILCNYLPLIREYLPTAAVEIESDIRAYASREDNFVYDLYTVEDGLNSNGEDKATDYPLVQVNDDDDEYYDGPLQLEYESDDSNAEDNPRNDYPDEESSRDDEDENRDPFNDLEGSDSQYEEEIVDVDEESEDNQRFEYSGDQHYTYPKKQA